MPARSNAFQEMVALLTAVMREDECVTVTPSAMLTDVITGNAREVDIAVETEVAGHKVVVGIECRDWKRPQNVSWVEEVHAKHLALPVHLTVAVSSSGFTNAALAKAEHYGIKTITPRELTSGFVGTVVNNLEKVVTKRAGFRVKTVCLQVELEGGELAWVEAYADALLYTPDGTEKENVGFIVQGIVDGNPAQQRHLLSATDSDKFMIIRTDGPSYNGQPLCISASRDGDQLPLAPIVGVHIQGPVSLDLIEVPPTHGDYDGTPYSSGSTAFGDIRVAVVATESGDGAVKWAGSATKPGGAQEIF